MVGVTGQCGSCGEVRELAKDGTERCWLCVRLDVCHYTATAARADNCGCRGADAELLRREGRL